ncbi:MAG: Spy/CpxP family protein refolding chaperone [Gammaproteobacteria bacterium]|nr:Spy/CpxP family protein refolding chaperone [Gammaproteobacteria bacterium]
MNRFTRLVIIGSGAVLIIGSITACSHKYREPEYRATKMLEWVADDLELNDVQKDKLTKLSEKMLQSRKNMREQFSRSKDEINQMLSQPTLDQKKILAMVRTHTQSMNEQAPDIIAAMADFYNTLSSEQRVKLREHMDKMHKRHGGGHHYGHHG